MMHTLDQLGPFIRWLWICSWQASVIAMLVLLTHFVLGRWLSPRWRLTLWSVVLLRLVLPVTPASTWSIFNLTPKPAPVAEHSPGIVPALSLSPLPQMQIVADASQPIELASGSFSPIDWMAMNEQAWTAAQMAIAIWLLGALLFAMSILIAAMRFSRRLKKDRASALTAKQKAIFRECCDSMAVRKPPRVILTNAVAAPALFGLLRPSLLIPPRLLDELGDGQLRHVLLHELAHLKRHDLAKNWLLLALQAMHWFNPILWFAFSRYRADHELACDSAVMSMLTPGDHQSYGQTLIHVLEQLAKPTPRAHIPMMVGIGESFTQLKRRMRAIAHFPRLAAWGVKGSLLGAALFFVIAASTLTSAGESKSPPESKPAATIFVMPKGIADSAHTSDDLNRQTLEKLNMPVTGIFENHSLINIIDYLRNTTGVNIAVYWNDLGSVGVEQDYPISLQLSNSSAKAVLKTVLELASSGNPKDPIMYIIDDGIVKISTASRLQGLSPRGTGKRKIPADTDKQTANLLLEQASSLSRQRQYHQALVIVNQVLDRTPDHDPDNFAARMMRDTIMPHAHVQQVRDAGIARKLDKAMDIDFKNTPFAQVIGNLHKQTGLMFYVDWTVLKNIGIKQGNPISLTVNQMSVTPLLDLIMKHVSVGYEQNPIGYVVDGGLIKISSKHQLKQETVSVKIYDISDIIKARTRGFGDSKVRENLVSQLLDLVRQHGRPEEWAEFGGDLSSVKELNGQLIVKTYPENHREILAVLNGIRKASPPQQVAIVRIYDIRDLLEPIRQYKFDKDGLELIPSHKGISDEQLSKQYLKQILGHVREIGNPEHWAANGGHINSVAELNGNLVVEALPEIHWEIFTLIGQFRKTRSLQIKYDTRLLWVDDAFFEKHINPLKLEKSSVDPQDLRFAMLDDLQARELIAAAKNSRDAISITAPRLTAFNSQHAYIRINREISYIHKIEKVKYADGIKYEPQLKVARPGFIMEVYGTISAERDFIRGRFRPILTHVAEPKRVAFKDGPADQELYTEEVEIDSWQRQITVSVPDNKTLLLTGEQKIGGFEWPEGINHSVKIQQPMRVIVLVKPTIVVPSEDAAAEATR